MQRSRTAKISDTLGRYYTPSAIASLLLQAIPDCAPQLVLDLGVGAGALISEATKKWPNMRGVTVDIDPKAKGACCALTSKGLVTHCEHNALDSNLATHIQVPLASVDVALCNPPYLPVMWQPHYETLLDDAGFSSALPKSKEVRAEVLFIAQNLCFLRSGGYLGLIIPDGLLSGEQFFEFRTQLLKKHRIITVIELPRTVFKNTDAKAHILVLQKDRGVQSPIRIQRLTVEGELTKVREITPKQAAVRMDSSHYEQLAAQPRAITLAAIGASIWRGKISSFGRKTVSVPVFHTSDFDATSLAVPVHFVILENTSGTSMDRLALEGDILIGRVGRSLEKKVCQVPCGAVVVTDAVLVLTVPKAYQLHVFQFLTSSAGRHQLKALSHGVSAQFITAKQVLHELTIPGLG